MLSKSELSGRLKRIKLLVVDVDGVLTDGRIYFDSEGRESRAFNYKDIMGISRLQKKGVKVALISGEKSSIIDRFCRKASIEKNYQNCREKDKAINEIADYYKFELKNICYIGDDINDIPIFKKVGVAVGVPNGWEGIKGCVHFITEKPGGGGAVREVCDLMIGDVSPARNTIQHIELRK